MIELMAGVTIMVVLVGIGVAAFSRFQARDRAASVKNEIISAVKLARTYATTSQVPSGYSSQLDYVSLTLTAGGLLTVSPVNITSGVGTSYFAKQILEPETNLTALGFGSLLFSVPEGKLLELKGNASPPLYEAQPVDIADTVSVTISSGAVGTTDSLTVMVSANGTLTEGKK